MGKVKYYKLGEESDEEVISYDNKRVEITNLKEKEKEDNEYTKNVNIGLKNVLDKDIEEMSIKLQTINKKINSTLSINEVVITDVFSDDIKDVDDNLTKLENAITQVIIKKNNVKVGIFSTKKLEKKEKIKSLEEALEFLTKCQNDIIALRDEYIKLVERKEKVKNVEEEDKKSGKSFEQTINFYLKQKKES